MTKYGDVSAAPDELTILRNRDTRRHLFFLLHGRAMTGWKGDFPSTVLPGVDRDHRTSARTCSPSTTSTCQEQKKAFKQINDAVFGIEVPQSGGQRHFTG